MPDSSLETEENGKSFGLNAWLLPVFLLLLIDVLFLGPALVTNDQRAAWDPVFLRTPFSSENVDLTTIPRSKGKTDWARQFVPWSYQVRESWQDGRIALWDPLSGLGKPLAGNIQSEVFSPYLVLNLLSGDHYFDLKQFAVLFLSQLFCLLLARSLKLSFWAGLFVALGFSFSSYLQSWILHPHGGVAAFYPALVWAFLRLRRKQNWPRFALASLMLAITILAGHVETAALVGLGSACFTFFLPVGRPVRDRALFFFAVGGVVFLAFAISAIQLVPFLDYLSESGLIEERHRVHRIHQLFATKGWQHALTIFDPDILGDHLKAYRGQVSFIETGFFFGSGILTLAVLGIVSNLRARPGLCLAATLTAIFGIVFSFNVDWAQEILRFLPGFGEMPTRRFNFIAALPVALLAGLGIDRLRVLHSKAWAIGFIVAGTLLVSVPTLAKGIPADFDFSPELPAQSYFWFIIPTILSAAMCLKAHGSRFKTVILSALILVIAAEGIVRWRQEIPIQPARLSPPKSEAMDFLKKGNEVGRTYALLWALPPEHNALYGVKSPRAYDAIRLERYDRALKATGAIANVQHVQNSIGTYKGFMDLLNVRWLLSSVPSHRLVQPVRSYFAQAGKEAQIKVSLRPNEIIDLTVAGTLREALPEDILLVVRSEGQKVRVQGVGRDFVCQGRHENFGKFFPKVDRAMRFVTTSLPRGLKPQALRFQSLAKKPQEYTFTFTSQKGPLLVVRYAPGLMGEVVLAKELNGGAAIFERPSSLPYTFIAPTILVAADQAEALKRICRPEFDPHRQTILETDGWVAADFPLRERKMPESFEFERVSPEEFLAEDTTKENAILVVGESFSKGWRAYVDDAEVPVFPANYLMMGLPVRSGSQRIRLLYRPRYFHASVVLSLFSLVLTLAFLCGRRKQDGSVETELSRAS